MIHLLAVQALLRQGSATQFATLLWKFLMERKQPWNRTGYPISGVAGGHLFSGRIQTRQCFALDQVILFALKKLLQNWNTQMLCPVIVHQASKRRLEMCLVNATPFPL